MARELSPEEKLLNLIKKKKAKVSPEEPKKDIPIAGEKIRDYPKKEGSTSSFILDLGNMARLKDIKAINTVLFIMLIVIILYFIIDIFLIPPRKLAVEEEGPPMPPQIEEVESKPYSYYSKDLKKGLFKPLVKEEVEEAKPEVPIEELMGNLALLGIVSGDNPQAIIEDKTKKKTFFLREGQSAGGIFLKRIEDGTVTVIYKGEEFNLTL